VVGPSVEEGVVEWESREGEVPDRAEEPEPVGTKEKRIPESNAHPDAEARIERIVHERVVKRVIKNGVVQAQVPVFHPAVDAPVVVAAVVIATIVLATVLIGVRLVGGFIDRGELRVTPGYARRHDKQDEHPH